MPYIHADIRLRGVVLRYRCHHRRGFFPQWGFVGCICEVKATSTRDRDVIPQPGKLGRFVSHSELLSFVGLQSFGSLSHCRTLFFAATDLLKVVRSPAVQRFFASQMTLQFVISKGTFAELVGTS